jgi:hypothetical protein
MKYLNILLFTTVVSQMLDEFANRDIYFSTVNDKIPEKFKIDSLVNDHFKTDTIIFKFEKEIDMSECNTDKYFSIMVNKDYYDITSSLDLGLKNFVEFSANNTSMYKNFRYHKRTFVDSGFDLFNMRYNATTYDDGYSDIIYDGYSEVRKYVSDRLFRWDENNTFIEFIFVHNDVVKRNELYKIFVYFSSAESYNYITLHKEYKRFNNIFMYYKDSMKLLKYTRNYKGKEKDKVSIKDFSPVNNLYRIDFDKKVSIFHNMMKIQADRSFFKTPKNDFACIDIYQYISEDIYIEKNELIGVLKSLYKTVTVSASNFIDQELSADNIVPYYVALRLCDDVSKLQNISYPFHFRYQPPAYNSNHAEVIVPLPVINLVHDDHTLDDFIMTHLKGTNLLEKEDFFVRKNKGRGETYNERKFFYREVLLKQPMLERYQNYKLNKSNVSQYIPIGKMRDLVPVATVTAIVSFIGFVMIFYEIIKYTMRSRQRVKEE